MQLCTERRGIYVRTEYLSPTRAILVYEMPLAEVIYDLYDKLKSVTHGYGTMDYEFLGYRAGRPGAARRAGASASASMRCRSSCTASTADRRGRKLVKKLREEIDRHLFEVAIQAAIGSRIIARETIAAMKKNVTAKCYGGDITPQAQAVGQAGRRQETHEAGRPGGDSAGSVPGGAGVG